MFGSVIVTTDSNPAVALWWDGVTPGQQHLLRPLMIDVVYERQISEACDTRLSVG